MKELIAKGKDVDGNEIEFDCSDGSLSCWGRRLTDLIIPEGVKEVWCSYNQLTELNVPEGVETVSCENNQISHLDIPESVIDLWCDKEVTGLERYVGKVKMKLK